MRNFQITTKIVEPNIVSMFVKGSLDIIAADKLYGTFKRSFAQKTYKFMVDLSQVKYIGSAAVGVFISILDTLEQNKGTIVFVNPSPKVKVVFELFKLSTFYKIVFDKTSALKELQG